MKDKHIVLLVAAMAYSGAALAADPVKQMPPSTPMPPAQQMPPSKPMPPVQLNQGTPQQNPAAHQAKAQLQAQIAEMTARQQKAETDKAAAQQRLKTFETDLAATRTKQEQFEKDKADTTKHLGEVDAFMQKNGAALAGNQREANSNFIFKASLQPKIDEMTAKQKKAEADKAGLQQRLAITEKNLTIAQTRLEQIEKAKADTTKMLSDIDTFMQKNGAALAAAQQQLAKTP